MITINATGDTTLHTAGKYCSEDILVKVPAGGSSSDTNVELCEIDITLDGDMTGPCISGLIYSTIENSIIKTKYVSVSESFSKNFGTLNIGTYSGTISCIIGTNIYLLDVDMIWPSSFTTSGKITSNGSVDPAELVHECTVSGGSTGSITVNY